MTNAWTDRKQKRSGRRYLSDWSISVTYRQSYSHLLVDILFKNTELWHRWFIDWKFCSSGTMNRWIVPIIVCNHFEKFDEWNTKIEIEKNQPNEQWYSLPFRFQIVYEKLSTHFFAFQTSIKDAIKKFVSDFYLFKFDGNKFSHLRHRTICNPRWFVGIVCRRRNIQNLMNQ